MIGSPFQWMAIAMSTLASYAEAAPFPGAVAVTPSQLNANSTLYDGKLIRVKGYALVDFERREFYDSESSSRTGDPFKTCVTIVNASQILQDMNKYNRKMLVLSGIFMKDVSKKPYVQIGGCNLTAVDVTGRPQPELVPDGPN